MTYQKEHHYSLMVRWTGNLGSGTSEYRAYSRDHEITVEGKSPIPGSADLAFRGNPARYNPEEMLVASLSTCHMLWYLHLCADAGIVVLEYRDIPVGTMIETSDGGGRFTSLVLHPQVRVAAETDQVKALSLHEQAHHLCYIANSVNFPVTCEAEIETAG